MDHGRRLRDRLRRTALIAAVALALAGPAWADPGDLDPTFGRNGIARSRLSAERDEAFAMAVQPDGKILVGGSIQSRAEAAAPTETGEPRYDALVARFLPDGRRDRSFGNGGVVRFGLRHHREQFEAIAVQVDGRIVVAGVRDGGLPSARVLVARLLPDGSRDRSFGDGGVVKTPLGRHAWLSAVLVARDGKIVVGGTGRDFRWAIVRYLADGRRDRTFGRGGYAVFDREGSVTHLAEQADGAIVACGRIVEQLAVARILPDGRPDVSFGGTGFVATRFGRGSAGGGASTVAIDAAGSIVAAGYGSRTGLRDNFGLVRHLAGGELDPSFGEGGTVLTRITDDDDFAGGMVVHPDGRILLAGSTALRDFTYRIALARYLPDGTLDATFGRDGIVLTRIGKQTIGSGVAMQGTDRIVVAGIADWSTQSADVALARYEW